MQNLETVFRNNCKPDWYCAFIHKTLKTVKIWFRLSVNHIFTLQSIFSQFCFMNRCTVPNKGGKGNGNPLQYPCLENPMDGGAW